MKVAVLIAIEKYADPRVRPVQFAEADATAFADVLEQQGFLPADRVVLVSHQATKSSIESRVKRVLKQLGTEDELVFYYAGHGFSKGGTNYITCCDTDLDDPADTSIQLNWLFQQFKDSDCKQIAFFFDSGESGLPATDDVLDICSDLNDSDLKEFFASGELYVCFAACKTNESSHTSGALKHGIWMHHVIEAFDGKAPTALMKGTYLTSSSLQSYLMREVPRTLTKTFTTNRVQTPWMAGASGGEFRLADLTDILAKRKAAADPHAGQIKNVTLLAQRTKDMRSLSGFKKTHSRPDRMTSASEAFVARISREEVAEDVTGAFARLKSAFSFRRADLQLTDYGEGAATIGTPYFNYSITVQLNPKDTSQVTFRRTVDSIKVPDRVLSDEFAEVFGGVFDTVEFETPGFVDLPALIDRIEAVNDERILINYDPEVTQCTLHVPGVVGAITLTSSSLSIVHPRPESPQYLLQSFFQILRVLVDQHNVRLIPLEDKAGNESP